MASTIPPGSRLKSRGLGSPNQPLTFTLQRGIQTIRKNHRSRSKDHFRNRLPRLVPQTSPSSLPTSKVTCLPPKSASRRRQDRRRGRPPRPLNPSMIDRLQLTKDKPIQLDILRDGKSLTLTGAPVLSTSADGSQKQYRLGFSEPDRDQDRQAHAFRSLRPVRRKQ